jgi:hypothetical protein
MRRFHSACNGCILVSSPDFDFLYLRYTFANSARALSSGHMPAQLDDPRNIQSAISFTSTFSKLPLTFSLGGGMGTSRNRTTWPIGGGALAVQPGWFQGHSKGFFYVNMGFGLTMAPITSPTSWSPSLSSQDPRTDLTRAPSVCRRSRCQRTRPSRRAIWRRFRS